MVEQKKTPSQQPKEQFLREHFHEIDWSQYEAEGGTEKSPIRFYKSKNNPSERVVRFLAQGFDYPVAVRIPEVQENPKLKKLVSNWEVEQNKVMLDTTTLWLLAEIASRYNRRQPIILEGPPAVSKTFTIWLFSCIVGLPYTRLNISADTNEHHILGSRTPDVKRKVNPDLYRIIDSKAVTSLEEVLQKIPEESRSMQDRSALLAISNIRDLKQQGVELDDFDVFHFAALLQPVLPAMNLITEVQFAWQDSELMFVIEHGGIAALDEPNVIDNLSNLEVLLPVLEVNNRTIRMPAARGADIIRHPDAHIIHGQNPTNVAGRQRLTDAYESRNAKVVLPNMTQEYVQNILKFFMTGNEPQVRVKSGELISGRTGVDTPHRKYLENMPKIDAVISGIAKIHTAITEAVNEGAIGRVKKNGGSYVFDQRDIAELLDSMVATINRDMVEDTPDGLKPVEVDWVYVIKKALKEVYLTCLPGDETSDDYKYVNDIIETSPLWSFVRSKKDVTYVQPGTRVNVTDAGLELPLD